MEQEGVIEGLTAETSLHQAAVLQQQQYLQAQQLQQQHMQALHQFWQDQLHDLELKGKNGLPLARIKKIMKFDEDVQMISSEAPALFAKACEVFITELTMRAFFHTEENKRRTLQRNDIAMAISRSDTFDFLIDIVPREDMKGKRLNGEDMRAAVAPDYFYLPQETMDAQQIYQQQLRFFQQQQLYQLQLQQQGIDQNSNALSEGDIAPDVQMASHHQMALEGMAMVNAEESEGQEPRLHEGELDHLNGV